MENVLRTLKIVLGERFQIIIQFCHRTPKIIGCHSRYVAKWGQQYAQFGFFQNYFQCIFFKCFLNWYNFRIGATSRHFKVIKVKNTLSLAIRERHLYTTICLCVHKMLLLLCNINLKMDWNGYDSFSSVLYTKIDQKISEIGRNLTWNWIEIDLHIYTVEKMPIFLNFRFLTWKQTIKWRPWKKVKGKKWICS